MKTTNKKVGKRALPAVDKHSHINDPKLSDCGARRAGCMGAERRRAEAASVTRGAVRCSAWLGVAVLLCEACITDGFSDGVSRRHGSLGVGWRTKERDGLNNRHRRRNLVHAEELVPENGLSVVLPGARRLREIRIAAKRL